MSEEKIMLWILGIGLLVLLFVGGIATVIAAFTILITLLLGVDGKRTLHRFIPKNNKPHIHIE